MRDLHTHLVSKKTEVIVRARRQLRGFAGAVSGLLPAGNGAVVNLHLLQAFDFRGEILKPLALVLIFDPHGNFRQGIKDIQLGDDERIQMIDASAIARDGNIEPSAASRASGNRAVLASALANLFPFRPQEPRWGKARFRRAWRKPWTHQ